VGSSEGSVGSSEGSVVGAVVSGAMVVGCVVSTGAVSLPPQAHKATSREKTRIASTAFFIELPLFVCIHTTFHAFYVSNVAFT
jgi:hypothetical protein